MNLVPYLLFFSIYSLLSSRSTHERALTTYLEQPLSDRWYASAYEVEGPLFQVVMSLALHTPTLWKRHRLQHLKRKCTTEIPNNFYKINFPEKDRIKVFVLEKIEKKKCKNDCSGKIFQFNF